MSVRAHTTSVLIVAVVAVASCGGDGNQSSAGGSNGEQTTAGEPETTGATTAGQPADVAEACELLSEQDVGAAVGTPVTAQSPGDVVGDDTDCEWLLDPSQPEQFAVRLVASNDPTLFDLLRPEDAEDLAGLGDNAYSSEVLGFTELGILAGGITLHISGSADDGVTADEVRQLAELAVNRL